jgi:hypothetical protein
MVKLYETYVVKKIVVGPANTDCPPTFIYSETPKRGDGILLPLMRVSDSECRSDATRLPLMRLNESEQRSDACRIPSAAVTPPDNEARSDAPKVPFLKVSESGARRDNVTLSQLYDTAGTFTYTVPASGLLGGVIKLEGIGAGGLGGIGAITFGGGGGKGGAYARRNAWPVNPGDVITIVIGNNYGIDTTIAVNGTIVLRASGGAAGTAGTTLAGGTGATTYVSTPLGDVIFNGGNGENGGVTSAGAGGGGAGVAANTTGQGPIQQFLATLTGRGGDPGTALAGGGVVQSFGGAQGGIVQASGRASFVPGGAKITYTL